MSLTRFSKLERKFSIKTLHNKCEKKTHPHILLLKRVNLHQTWQECNFCWNIIVRNKTYRVMMESSCGTVQQSQSILANLWYIITYYFIYNIWGATRSLIWLFNVIVFDILLFGVLNLCVFLNWFVERVRCFKLPVSRFTPALFLITPSFQLYLSVTKKRYLAKSKPQASLDE